MFLSARRNLGENSEEMVGKAGFEHAALRSRTERSSE
jgi:hypothetical protein